MATLTKFDKGVLNRTLRKIRSGKEFLYISTVYMPHDKRRFTIGDTSKEHFDKHNKDWGSNNEHKMVKATLRRTQTILDAGGFIEDEERELMIETRAKSYIKELKKAFKKQTKIKNHV
jgi:hypothetical protein